MLPAAEWKQAPEVLRLYGRLINLQQLASLD